MASQKEKELLTQIAAIGELLNTHKKEEILKKQDAQKKTAIPAATPKQTPYTRTSTPASTPIVTTKSKLSRPSANKTWTPTQGLGTTSNFPRATTTFSNTRMVSPKGNKTWTPDQGSSRAPHSHPSTVCSMSISTPKSRSTHPYESVHAPAHAPTLAKSRPNNLPKPRGVNGQHLTWTAPGLSVEAPRSRGTHPRTHPSQSQRRLHGNHNIGNTPVKSGKKPKVVSIGSVLFAMDPDMSRLTRMSTPTMAEVSASVDKRDANVREKVKDIDGEDLLKRIVIGDSVYLKVDGNTYKRNDPKSTIRYCKYFCLYGKCTNLDCPYVHDPAKVNVCRQFIKGKQCKFPEGECPLSHVADKNKMPLCMTYYNKGQCKRGSECYDLHIDVDHSKPACKDFINGYCPNGSACAKRHHWTCPEFSEKGSCHLGKKCSMRHITYTATGQDKKRKIEVAPKGFWVKSKKPRDDADTVNASSKETPTSSKPVSTNTLTTQKYSVPIDTPLSIRPNLEGGYLRLSTAVVPQSMSTSTKDEDGKEREKETLSIRPRFSFSKK
eukprot:CFRG8248T1